MAFLATALALALFGTLKPWSVAVEKLADLSPGPYIPLSYSYRGSTSDVGSRTYRSQLYVVASQVGKSFSTYRVTQQGDVAVVEEVRYGCLYPAAFVTVFHLGHSGRYGA